MKRFLNDYGMLGALLLLDMLKKHGWFRRTRIVREAVQ